MLLSYRVSAGQESGLGSAGWSGRKVSHEVEVGPRGSGLQLSEGLAVRLEGLLPGWPTRLLAAGFRSWACDAGCSGGT